MVEVIIIYCFNPERQIDGDAFSHLSREDIASIFPAPEKFIMASKLYKVVQCVRSSLDTSNINTNDLLNDLDETFSRSSKPSESSSASTSSSSSRKRSKPESHSDPQPKKRHSDPPRTTAECGSFKLPVFSPDLQRCIRNDAFYTPTQRNRLIKESCVALRGYYWEQGKPITNDAKRSVAKMLCDLAPTSLGDQASSKKSPEVSIDLHVSATYYTIMYFSFRLVSMVRLSSGFRTTLTLIVRHVEK